MRRSTTHTGQTNPRKPTYIYFSPGIFFSGQRHSMSAADIYPQPSGWGAVSVRRTLLQGRTDLHTGQVDTWKVKLAKCGGVVRNPQAQVLLQTNLSPPSTSQSCRGSQVLGERNPAVSPQKYFVSTPSIVCPRPPQVWDNHGNTGHPQNIGTPSSQVGTTQQSTLTWIFLNKIKKYQN